MTLTLILTRHAKSSWDDLNLEDHERPLNARGQTSARLMGDWLRTNYLLPQEALVSSAARAQETFERLSVPCLASIFDGLYHAGADVMMAHLKKATQTCVVMVGHNPGISDFAEKIVAVRPAHSRFRDYPTCATLVVRFQQETWRSVGWHQGHADHFILPRELS